MLQQLSAPRLYVNGMRHALQPWLVQATLTIGVEDATLQLELDSCPVAVFTVDGHPALEAEIHVGDFHGVIAAVELDTPAFVQRVTVIHYDWQYTVPDPWWRRLRSFVAPVVCGHWSTGRLWFRVFGWGLSVRDVRRYPEGSIYNERTGGYSTANNSVPSPS